MPDIIVVELKSDLEYIYKILGDLLNDLEGGTEGDICRAEMLERIKFLLMDTGAVLQKDIFNCDNIMSRWTDSPFR